MSAFIVGADHIDALLTFALDRRVSFWNPAAQTRTTIDRTNVEEIGRILLDENVRSVGHRYEGRIDGDEKNAAAAYTFRRFAPTLAPVAVLKAVGCYEYQACETDDFEASLAWRICAAIKAEAIHGLAGYEAAAWEIRRPVAAPVAAAPAPAPVAAKPLTPAQKAARTRALRRGAA